MWNDYVAGHYVHQCERASERANARSHSFCVCLFICLLLAQLVRPFVRPFIRSFALIFTTFGLVLQSQNSSLSLCHTNSPAKHSSLPHIKYVIEWLAHSLRRWSLSFRFISPPLFDLFLYYEPRDLFIARRHFKCVCAHIASCNRYKFSKNKFHLRLALFMGLYVKRNSTLCKNKKKLEMNENFCFFSEFRAQCTPYLFAINIVCMSIDW